MSFATPSDASRTSSVLHIVRRANAYYSAIAASLRASRRPTYHARKRAQFLQLQVNTDSAKKLDQKHVSTIPLPIIVPSTPPRPVVLHAPVPRYPSQVIRDTIKRAERPVLKCTIPLVQVTSQPLQSSRAELSPLSSNEENSKWSATTASDYSDEEMQLDEALPAYSSSGDAHLAAPVRPRMELARHARHASLCAPVDLNRWSWSSDGSSGNSSGSSSGASSSGPVTPYSNEDTSRPSIRIKRKSQTDIDMSDMIEKRPKFERKEWVIAATRRSRLSSAYPYPRKF